MARRPRTSITPSAQLRASWRSWRRPPRATRTSRPALEALEDRWLPATITWLNPVNGNWNVASNWDLGRIPGPTDDVYIPFSNVVVTFPGSPQTFDDFPGISPNFTQIKSLGCEGTLRVLSGQLHVLDTSTIDDLEMVGVNSILSSQETLRVDDLEMANGTLYANTLRVTGDFVWTGGTLGETDNVRRIELYGTTSLNGPQGKSFRQVHVTNYGEFNWNGGNVHFQQTVSFTNQTVGVFIARASGSLFFPTAFRPEALNFGRWIVDSNGTADFGSFTNRGDLKLDNGRMRAFGFVQQAGVTRLEGGSLASSSTLAFNGGQLQGEGTISGSVVNMGARVVPTPAGTAGHTITIKGNYSQSGNGVLALLVSGKSSSGNFDELVVEGTANLGGKLELRVSNLPATSDTYPVLSAGSVKGKFANVTTPTLTSTTLDVIYANTKKVFVTLTPKGVKPNPTPAQKDPTVINNGGIPSGGASTGGTTTGNAVPGVASSSLAGSGIAVDLARSVQQNSGLLALFLTGSSRDLTAIGGDSAANTFSGRLLAASQALASGEKSAAGRSTDSSGVADELFAAFPLNLPDLALPEEDELLSAAELNAAMLVGGARADILPQAGSQLSVVATLVASDESRATGEEQGESPLTGLFISPFALGALPAAPSSRPTVQVSMAEEAEAGEDEVEQHSPRTRVGGALVVLVAFAGVIVGLTNADRAGQRKACSGPGKRPSRTSRQ